MRLKPSIFALFVVFWALTSAYATTAQESDDGRMPPYDMNGGFTEATKSDPDPDPEKNTKSALSTNAGGSSGREIARDSIQTKLIKPFKVIEKPEKEEEDPLSFNFLYYIIEKFKLSDIIE
jgi:hypothetical protein